MGILRDIVKHTDCIQWATSLRQAVKWIYSINERDPMQFHRLGMTMTFAALLLAGIVQAQPRFPSSSDLQLSEPAPLPFAPGQPPLDHGAYYAPNIDQIQPITPYHEGGTYVGGAMLELYPHVVYRDTRKIHPHAIPYLVEVPLPQPRRKGCLDCGPTCGYVKICVPPCETPCVRVRRRWGKRALRGSRRPQRSSATHG